MGLGEIFDIKFEDTSVKIHNYMNMERKYAFWADGEWIKKRIRNYGLDLDLEIKNKLFQQQLNEYRKEEVLDD